MVMNKKESCLRGVHILLEYIKLKAFLKRRKENIGANKKYKSPIEKYEEMLNSICKMVKSQLQNATGGTVKQNTFLINARLQKFDTHPLFSFLNISRK